MSSELGASQLGLRRYSAAAPGIRYPWELPPAPSLCPEETSGPGTSSLEPGVGGGGGLFRLLNSCRTPPQSWVHFHGAAPMLGGSTWERGMCRALPGWAWCRQGPAWCAGAEQGAGSPWAAGDSQVSPRVVLGRCGCSWEGPGTSRAGGSCLAHTGWALHRPVVVAGPCQVSCQPQAARDSAPALRAPASWRGQPDPLRLRAPRSCRGPESAGF